MHSLCINILPKVYASADLSKTMNKPNCPCRIFILDKQLVECLAGLHTLEQVYWVDFFFFYHFIFKNSRHGHICEINKIFNNVLKINVD